MATEEPTAVILARIEGKLDRLIVDNTDHERRIRDGERERAELRAQLAEQRAWVRGWLIGLGCAAGVGTGSGLFALLSSLGGG